MIKGFIKTVALALAILILSTSVLCSCSYKAIKASDEDTEVVGQVGGIDVYMDELRFVTYTYYELLRDRFGDDIFEGAERDKYISMLKELVYSNITANYATLVLCNEVHIGLGEDAVLAKVEQQMNETVEALGGVRSYKKYLKENYLTDRLLRFNMEVDILQNELMYVYVDDIMVIESNDEIVYDIIMEEFIGVRHIFVAHSTDGARDKIGAAKARIDAGEKLSNVMADFNEDTDMSSQGLYIMKGYMNKEYEDVAFSLGVGDVSGIVEDELGFYIIERIKLTPQEILLRFDYLKELYQSYTFYSIVDKKQAELVFTPTDAGKSFMDDPLAFLK